MLGAKQLFVTVHVRPLERNANAEPQLNNVFALSSALEGREVATQMRRAKKIKKATKHKIVVEKAVTRTARLDNLRERVLQTRKQLLEPTNKALAHVDPTTALSCQKPSDRQKLLLPRSVSRVKPSHQTLQKWAQELAAAPSVQLSTGCQFVLLQPRTNRPARTFCVPGQRAQSRMQFTSIVLHGNGYYPTHEWDEASHLCGEPRCICLAHLRWEPLHINASRKYCHAYGQPCTHTPVCIIVPDDEKDRAYQVLFDKARRGMALVGVATGK
jgi:hypothetical protein